MGPVLGKTLQDKKIEFASNDINRLWMYKFKALGRVWVPPRVYIYWGTLRTPCGTLGLGNAQYCPHNHSIYMNQSFINRITRQVGDFAAITVLAHEYGHAVQHLLGLSDLNRYLVQEELQADCLAGVYAQDAMQRGLLDASDIPEATAQSYYGGAPKFRLDSHGTSQQRVMAFRMGYTQGFQACLSYSTWSP